MNKTRINAGHYLARPLKSVGSVIVGELQIVKVTDTYCDSLCVLTFGEEISGEVAEFHFIKRILNYTLQ